MYMLAVMVAFAVFSLVAFLYFVYRIFCMMDDIRFLAEAKKRERGGTRTWPVAFFVLLSVFLALLVLFYFAVRADSGAGALMAYTLLNPTQAGLASSAW